MLISCLMPIYNRFPRDYFLVEEALQSFLQQDYAEKELILCNDTPGQEVHFNHPQVRVLNTGNRFPSLNAKLRYMIDHAQGEALCRWDDDDISLPWRLTLSQRKLGEQEEWRSENHFYDEYWKIVKITEHPGNTHVHSIFTRRCLERLGGYCNWHDTFGTEDQDFTAALRRAGYPHQGELLPPEEVYYLYRWGVSHVHLSGVGCNPQGWERIGSLPISHGDIQIKPKWYADHIARVKAFIRDR